MGPRDQRTTRSAAQRRGGAASRRSGCRAVHAGRNDPPADGRGARMTTLVMRSLGRFPAPLAAIPPVLRGFEVWLIDAAAAFAASGEFDRLTSMVPATLKPALAPALTSFGSMTTIGYFDVLIVMMVVQWAIYLGTEPAGEI